MGASAFCKRRELAHILIRRQASLHDLVSRDQARLVNPSLGSSCLEKKKTLWQHTVNEAGRLGV